jgi:hypothetical protein
MNCHFEFLRKLAEIFESKGQSLVSKITFFGICSVIILRITTTVSGRKIFFQYLSFLFLTDYCCVHRVGYIPSLTTIQIHTHSPASSTLSPTAVSWCTHLRTFLCSLYKGIHFYMCFISYPHISLMYTNICKEVLLQCFCKSTVEPS